MKNEDFEILLGEHAALKREIEERKKIDRYAPNAIVETEQGELLGVTIQIHGLKDFDLSMSKIGFERCVTKERNQLKHHPLNIRRITFLVNGEEIEFAACMNRNPLKDEE